ncbi:TPA: hypothetical protein HA274_05325 [Candidatus Bathyarchaeota archaeon]|nr:hypothetical protein [Candidatus Bathyarchaeota archaeon]
MAKKNLETGNSPYSIDLTAIDGDGSFPCPKCATVISPEDETEEVYRIVNTKVMNDQLVELVIECSTCRSSILLTGFETPVEKIATK